MIDQMEMLERERRDNDHTRAFGLSHHPDGLKSTELRVRRGFQCVKDTMQQTIKEMILFSLLQQGGSLLMRTISKKKKGAVGERQIGKGAMRSSNGSPGEDGESSYLSH